MDKFCTHCGAPNPAWYAACGTCLAGLPAEEGMTMYEVQQVFTHEWVTISSHDEWDEAQDAAMEIMDDECLDTVRVMEV